MATRVVEGKKPYTGGKAISIDENKVISLNLRDENNLIIYDEGDDEIYVDLQLDDEITPTSAFPIGVNTGRVIVDNGWDLAGTIISAVTTSGDNIKLFYADEGTLWIDNGTGTFKQIYFKADVDSIVQAIYDYININVNTKTFELSSLSDLATAQEVYDWWKNGGYPILDAIIIHLLSGETISNGTGSLFFTQPFVSDDYTSHSTSELYQNTIILTVANDVAVSLTLQRGSLGKYLATDFNYSTPYTPAYDGSPATKKYVDDKKSTISVTLTAIGWSSNSQTVSATGVTASNTVIVSPDPSDYSDYTDAEIYCSTQGSGTLTFTCGTTPSNDIDVNVVILN